MKYSEVLLDHVKPLPYFEKDSLSLLGEPYGIKKSTVDTYISRYLKNKDIIDLKKRGVYVTDSFCKRHQGDISYRFYLANVLRTPSYVSSWTALQYYNLTTDIIHDITSVTTKTTRTCTTKVGNFTYHSIKKDLFSGFTKSDTVFSFFIASPSKALFDLLYFRTRRFSGMTCADIDELIDELRIDINEMERKEREAFYVLVKKYLHHE
jgi:hypothetical protein